MSPENTPDSRIFEKWSAGFDIQALREHLEKYVLPLQITQQSEAFGGWSVFSSTGQFTDGWHQGHQVLDQKEMSKDQIGQRLATMGAKGSMAYIHPTEICHGYLAEVMKQIAAKDLIPRRARIVRLTRGMSSSWHRDSPDNLLALRLHVPLITNDGCFFEVETETGVDRAHLPADGSAYFLRVNRVHRVTNQGTEDRFHLLMDVTDTKRITQF